MLFNLPIRDSGPDVKLLPGADGTEAKMRRFPPGWKSGFDFKFTADSANENNTKAAKMLQRLVNVLSKYPSIHLFLFLNFLFISFCRSLKALNSKVTGRSGKYCRCSIQLRLFSCVRHWHAR